MQSFPSTKKDDVNLRWEIDGSLALCVRSLTSFLVDCNLSQPLVGLWAETFPQIFESPHDTHYLEDNFIFFCLSFIHSSLYCYFLRKLFPSLPSLSFQPSRKIKQVQSISRSRWMGFWVSHALEFPFHLPPTEINPKTWFLAFFQQDRREVGLLTRSMCRLASEHFTVSHKSQLFVII